MTAGRVVLAGGVYWAIVFTCAFAFGIVKVVAVAPRVGGVAAVLIETPLVLATCWFASRWTLRRFAVGPRALERLAMGGVAFGLLMGAELGLSVFAFGRTPADWLAGLGTTAGAIGLAAQIAFGFIPVVQGATRAR